MWFPQVLSSVMVLFVVVRASQDLVCLPVLLDGFQKTDWVLDSAASQHITNDFLCVRDVVPPSSLKCDGVVRGCQS